MELLPTIRSNLNKSAEAYRSAEPYPHIVIDNFLPVSVLETVIEAFPRPDSDVWNERIKEAYQVKLASNNVDGAPPPIRDLMYQLNSATVLKSGMSRCLLKFSKRSLRIEIYAASAI